MFRKWLKNNAVSFAFVLPNLAISGLGQTFFLVYLHWTGWLAVLSWAICAGSGFEFGVLLAMLTRSNFRLGKWRYSYAPDDEP